MNPKPYDMEKLEDVKRWFREMRGYLVASRFLYDGTDREGRKYAYEGYQQLEAILTLPQPQSEAPPLTERNEGQYQYDSCDDCYYYKLQTDEEPCKSCEFPPELDSPRNWKPQGGEPSAEVSEEEGDH